MIRTLPNIGVAFGLLAGFASGQGSAPATGTIQGVVFAADTDGARSALRFGVFNVFNRTNYRDVQNDIDSYRFGNFFNGPSRTFHGKFVLEF